MSGFTIVELLVVIVVIAVLASISIVAFTGVQQRAKDSQRKSDIATIQKALELYKGENGTYPGCNGAKYVPNGVTANDYQTCPVSSLTSALVPNFISTLPKDPVNNLNGTGTTGYGYIYAIGWKLGNSVNPCGVQAGPTINYVLGAKLDTSVSACAPSGWWSRTDLGIIIGSAN